MEENGALQNDLNARHLQQQHQHALLLEAREAHEILLDAHEGVVELGANVVEHAEEDVVLQGGSKTRVVQK